MKSLSLIAVYLLLSSLSAQDLHIYYDVHNDSTWYVKNGKPVKELKIRKDKEVYFHLVEFNNYVYSAVFDASNYSLPPAGYGADSSSFRGFMPQLMSGLFPGGSLPFMNIPVFGSLMGAISGIAPAGGARGEQEDLVELKERLTTIQSETEAMNALIADINKREKSARILTGSIEYINTLCKTEAVAPSLIKQLLLEHFTDAFMLEASQVFSIKDMDPLNEKLLQIPALRDLAKKRSESFSAQASDLGKLVSRLKSTDHGIDELYALLQQYEKETPQIALLLDKLQVSLAPATEGSPSAARIPDYSAYIQTYYFKYIDLLNNDFSYTHHATAEGRYMVYTLQLFRKDSSQLAALDEIEIKPVKTIKLKVDSYGDFKIGTSFGVNGIRYGDKPQKFFVKDNVLSASDEDQFAPMLSSFINLSYSLGTTLTPVLSFGIGLPLKSSPQTESLVYFAGPGLYFGKKQSFMLSTGFMFSKVSRLANGLEVGNPIQIGDGVIPTEKKFDAGYYLGVAYRIGE